jgi:hypothetical protein
MYQDFDFITFFCTLLQVAVLAAVVGFIGSAALDAGGYSGLLWWRSYIGF